eukprot:9220101-Alexandrium_andersonii.AAC.1
MPNPRAAHNSQPPLGGRHQLQIPPHRASSGDFGIIPRTEPDGDDEKGWAGAPEAVAQKGKSASC